MNAKADTNLFMRASLLPCFMGINIVVANPRYTLPSF